MRRAAVIVATAVPLLVVTPAHAGWTAPALVSATATEQAQPSGGAAADRGSDSAVISADGRYVAFRTGARNLVDTPEPNPAFFRRGGIVRKDLETGAIELVAPGARYPSAGGVKSRNGATRPSMSADGRWIAFQTDDGLVPADTNGVTDVYVRDMDRPADDPAAYVLASALDGTDLPPVYGSDSVATIATVGSALSTDGTRVLFAAEASTLPAGDGPTPAGARQLYVRDLASRQTMLVTATRDPVTGAMTAQPAGEVADADDAVLSADGTTVAWKAASAETQARVIAGTPSDGQSLLVRRITDGPSASTQRVAGLDDPRDPGCPAGGAISSVAGPVASACDGPFAQRPSFDDLPFPGPPTVAPDGRRVTFKSAYPLRSATALQKSQPQSALYTEDLSPGVTAKDGLQRILPGTVEQFVPSRDGRTWIVGVTGVPDLPVVGPTPRNPVARELYSVDVASGSAELITSRVEGTATAGGELMAPAVSANGSRVVFQSEKSDLVEADGNGETDVFVSSRTNDAPEPATQLLPAAPAPVPLRALRKLRVTATPLKDGRIRLTVVVPSAGRVDAAASAATGRGRARRSRTVAKASGKPRAAGAIRRTLTLSASTRRRVGRTGLPATVRVTFRATGARTALRRTITTTFRRPATSAKRGRG